MLCFLHCSWGKKNAHELINFSLAVAAALGPEMSPTLSGRNRVEGLEVLGTVDREIAPVERKERPDFVNLGKDDECGVGQIHWPVSVLSHQAS